MKSVSKFLILLVCLCISNVIAESADCEVYRGLYKKWKKISLFGTDCCDSSTVECNINNEITEIDLSFQNIKVELTNSDVSELKKLKSLEKLDLSYNDIYGKFPSDLESLNIEEINLKRNKYTGDFPKLDSPTNICLERNNLKTDNYVPTTVDLCSNANQLISDDDIDDAIFTLSAVFIFLVFGIPIVVIIICIVICCCICKSRKKYVGPPNGQVQTPQVAVYPNQPLQGGAYVAQPAYPQAQTAAPYPQTSYQQPQPVYSPNIYPPVTPQMNPNVSMNAANVSSVITPNLAGDYVVTPTAPMATAPIVAPTTPAVPAPPYPQE